MLRWAAQLLVSTANQESSAFWAQRPAPLALRVTLVPPMPRRLVAVAPRGISARVETFSAAHALPELLARSLPRLAARARVVPTPPRRLQRALYALWGSSSRPLRVTVVTLA